MNYTELTNMCSDVIRNIHDEVASVPDETQRAALGCLLLAAAVMMTIWLALSEDKEIVTSEPVARPRLRKPQARAVIVNTRQEVVKALSQGGGKQCKIVQGRKTRKNADSFGLRYELFKKAPLLSEVLTYSPDKKELKMRPAYRVPVIKRKKDGKMVDYTTTDFLYDLSQGYICILPCS